MTPEEEAALRKRMGDGLSFVVPLLIVLGVAGVLLLAGLYQ